MARLHRERMRWVLDRVLAGEFPEGALLPREVDLAERFGVSRGVTREVIRALEERGSVTSLTRRPCPSWQTRWAARR
jgi:DNA-binding FadR family transcriptional regulator